MDVTASTLDKLAFPRVREALAERAATMMGRELALALLPHDTVEEAEAVLERVSEIVTGGALSLGGMEDVRLLLARIRRGDLLEGSEILAIAYTLDGASSLRRAILESERPALSKVALGIGSFDGVLRVVREQLDRDGNVRDDATPKLAGIRRRLNPLRGRIRERLTRLLESYSSYVQDPIVTLRRDRYVIPIKAHEQSRVPGLALARSDSGATVFIEPAQVVDLNNELALLEMEEKDEVRRILLELGRVLAGQPLIDQTLEVVAQLDLLNASATLAKEWRLARPSFDAADRVRLEAARHPLIEGCVPNDIELDEERRLLIVTGPNAGGKTVLIKTLGLAAVMAQAGLFVAASSERPPLLPRVDAVLADIGDEQSIEASLSTYAGHLTNLKAIVDRAGPSTLVLIDELGSGTDPDEGAALSQAILETVLRGGARGLITTHLAPLKVFAGDTPGVTNAAMRFDVERLAPTYQLIVGQPGRSYALAIAERLGLPASLLARASDLLGPEGERLESLLVTLEQRREELTEEVADAKDATAKATAEAKLLRSQIDTLRAREAELLAAAAERADDLLQATLQQATKLKREAREDQGRRAGALGELMELRRQTQELARPKGHRPAKRPERAGGAPRQRDTLAPGTKVRVESYGAEGEVVELRGDDRVVVQLGLLKVEIARREAQPLRKRPEDRAQTQRGQGAIAPVAFDKELNLRGARVEPALEQVRDFILEAHAMKMESVRILHGKGTGALRDAVRSYLRDERLVERYEDAVPYEGGHGVTVAYLRS